MKKYLAALAALALVAASIALAPIALAGCSPAATKEEARDTYAAQQMKCVEKYDTREEIDACRADIKEYWGRDAGRKDGSK